MKRTVTSRFLCSLFCLLLFIATPTLAGDNEVLDRVIRLPKSKGTVYHLLNQVSEKTGYLFIYDSKLVNNERIVKLKGGSYTVRQAIYDIIDNHRLELRTVGNHILIHQPTNATALPSKTIQGQDSISFFTLEGRLLDKLSKESIPYATVSVVGTSIGSVTNQNGGFRLHLPDSLRTSQIAFSHLGYVPQQIEASLLISNNSTLSLEPKVIPIQEVIIRVVNPIRLLREMMEFREKNYSRRPVYLTSFYREGIERKSKFVSLTEAIFKIYKPAYQDQLVSDQVKLLKMRCITNRLEKDTLVAKMKSGIDACLQLDLIKSLPDFLTPDPKNNQYTYTSSDLTVIDGRLANVISFEQREGVNEPLYRGELYIDSESSALLRTRFEIHPKYVTKAADMLVEKKSRNIRITPQKIVYTTSYKLWNETYYMNHVRGDLYFKVKTKKRTWGSTSLHTWFEMVTCKIDTEQVSRFPRSEKLPTRTIFADTNFRYDESFWENFNVIPPEEELSNAIEKIASKIEETGWLPR